MNESKAMYYMYLIYLKWNLSVKNGHGKFPFVVWLVSITLQISCCEQDIRLFNEIYNTTETNKQEIFIHWNVWLKCFTQQWKRGVQINQKATNESETKMKLWITFDTWSHIGHTQQAGCSRALKKIFSISVRRNRPSGQIWDSHAILPPPSKKKIRPFFLECNRV